MKSTVLKLEIGSKTLAAWSLFIAFMALIVTASKFGIIRPAYGAVIVEGAIALILAVTLILEGVYEGKLTLDFGTYTIVGVAVSLAIYGLAAIGGIAIPAAYDAAVGVLFAIGFGATIYEVTKK